MILTTCEDRTCFIVSQLMSRQQFAEHSELSDLNVASSGIKFKLQGRLKVRLLLLVGTVLKIL